MLLAIAILIAVACCIREDWSRVRDGDRQWNNLLRDWFLKGVGAPTTAWAIINLGISERFPALIPRLAIAQSSGVSWGRLWIDVAVNGAGFIVICWAAVTYVWMIFLIAREVGDTREFRTAALSLGLPLFFLALLITYHSRWTVLPSAILVVLMPLVHRLVTVVETVAAPAPMYGAAHGKINFGKYEDAEIEVINQLEKKENDFNGWMLLAELYATKYHRLEDAAQVVVDLCRDPSITEVEASVACHKLADWQLQIGMNPGAARAALDLLIQRAPGSHVAHMAELRLKQLPRTREDLLDDRKPKSIRLPALREEFAPPNVETDPGLKHEASVEANRLSDRLREDPNNFEARERLAILLAEKLGQVNAGIEQLRLMLNMPEAMGEKAAKWLAQIATWERHLNKNESRFRALIAEIIRLYPNTTYGYAARRQLKLIEDAALNTQTSSNNSAPIRIRLEMPETGRSS